MSIRVSGTRRWAWLLLHALVACGGKSFESQGAGAGEGAGAGGGGADRTACAENPDCTLLAKGCCECGVSPLSGYAAINVAYSDAFSAERCAPGVACGPCQAPTDNDPAHYYIATCVAGHCAALDLHEAPFTDCSADSDCVARAGTECCDACETSVTLSFNASRSSDLQSLLCGAEQAKCRACTRATTGVGVFPRCENGKCSLQGGCNLCIE